MRTLIRDVRVFDGDVTTARSDVLIDGDRIAAPDAQPVDVEVDGSGRTLLPGLIDAHTHAVDGSLAQALAHGVTTELDMFSLPSNLARQRLMAAERDDVADIRSSGVLATPPGGHPSQLLDALDGAARAVFGDAAGEFDTITDGGSARAFVEARLAEGADYLKIVVDDGATADAQLPALAPGVVAALVEAAHSAGLRTIAHAVTAREAAIALDAGIDGLAHVWSAGGTAGSCERLAQRVAAHDVFVVSTLGWFEVLDQHGGNVEVIRNTPVDATASDGTASAAGPVAVAAALRRAGVPVLAGTDATPFAPAHGAGMHRELELLTRAGFTNEEVLAAATSVPARHFGLTDRGRIAPGLRADLVLVAGDPTTDITATSAIVDVWRRGVRQTRP
jgi:imidazolonepropionase-like amidohydrolase